MIDVRIPNLGKATEATITTWHVKDGDRVTRDQNLADIETDKVVLELLAPENGIVANLLKVAGAKIVSGEVVAQLDAVTEKEATASIECTCFICNQAAMLDEVFCPNCESRLNVSPQPNAQPIVRSALGFGSECYATIRIPAITLIGLSSNAPNEVLKKKLQTHPNATCAGLSLVYPTHPTVVTCQDDIAVFPGVKWSPGGFRLGGSLEVSEHNLVQGSYSAGINPKTKRFEIFIEGVFVISVAEGSALKNADTLAMLSTNTYLVPRPVFLLVPADPLAPPEQFFGEIKFKEDRRFVDLWVGFSEQPLLSSSQEEPWQAPVVPFELIGLSESPPKRKSGRDDRLLCGSIFRP